MTAKIISFANSASSQGKSSTAWLLAGELTRRNYSVIVLDADVVNAQTADEPVISGYVNADAPPRFQIVPIGKAKAELFESHDYVIIDGSRQPPKEIRALIEQKSDVLVVPIKDNRGYKAGLQTARNTFMARQASIVLTLNGYRSQPNHFQSLQDFLGDKLTLLALGNRLSNIADLTDAGAMPWQHNSREYSDIIDAAGMLADAVTAISSADKPELSAVAA